MFNKLLVALGFVLSLGLKLKFNMLIEDWAEDSTNGLATLDGIALGVAPTWPAFENQFMWGWVFPGTAVVNVGLLPRTGNCDVGFELICNDDIP